MSSSDIAKVQEIISNADIELRSIEVVKQIPLELDTGNLAVCDTNEFDKEKFKLSNTLEEYLKEIARDNVQFVINHVWDLPSETIDNITYARLPAPLTRVPREKPIPKPRPPTKWEEFAKSKGIQKKKKGNKLWDDVLQKWVPRYGYLKVQAEKDKNWLIEVPNNADPYEDQFAKNADKKKEHIARNELLRLQNLAKAKNIKLPKLGVTSENLSSKTVLEKAVIQSKVSTASLGKFQKDLPNEKHIKVRRGEKRKLPSNDTTKESLEKEKKEAVQVLSKMKKMELDYETAVNKQIKMDNVEMSQKLKKGATAVRRSKRGIKSRGKSEQKALRKGYLQKSLKKTTPVLKQKSTNFKLKNSGKGRESKQKAKGGKRNRK